MKLKSRRVLVAVLAGAAVAGGAGAAIATAQTDSRSPTAFLDAVAKHLGISSEKLQDATKAAAIDQVDAALADGKITKEQAERLKERIESGEFGPFLGPRFLGPRFFGPPGHYRGPGFHLHAPGEQLSAAAEYLDLSVADLREKLRDGQSLADVAKAEGKSVEGLEQALLAEAKKKLDEAVNDGDLTRAQADEIFDRIESHIDDVVNGSVETWRHRFRGPSDGASFGGAAA